MIKKILRTLIVIILILSLSGCKGVETTSKASEEAQPAQAIKQDSINQADFEEESKQILKEPKDLSVKNSNPPSVQKLSPIPILYYHSVMLELGNEVRMPPDQFEAQMAYLSNNGYQSITMNQLYQAFYQGGSLPPKPFVVTFDDGYVDNYTTAFPILKKYGFTATVFMVSSYVDGEGFMSWPQLKELVASGWEIEGHTKTHPYLSKIERVSLLDELKSSKELLEQGLGQKVNFLAYSYGDFNSVVSKAVKEAGYLMAFTTQRGWASHKEDQWQVKRVYCYANMGQNEFSRRIQNSNY